MNKLDKFLLFLLALGATSLFLTSCEDYKERLSGFNPEGSAVDVSSRITGFSPEKAGAGAVLTVNGNNLSEVIRVYMGQLWVDDFEATASAVTFTVPPNISLGQNTVVLVFAGAERATSSIEVLPLPSITYFTPKAVADGDEVTILGNNLSFVSSISISGKAATIISKENARLSFTVPAGISSDVIQMTSITGGVTSSTESVIACSAEPDKLACLPVINTNGSFEEGEAGEVGAVQVPGWNLGGSLITSEITDKEYYDGFQCAKITINEIGPNPWSIQPTSVMHVVPGEEYHLSMWVKGTGIANIKFAIDQGGTPGYAEYGNPELAVTSGEWQEVSYYFTPETSNTEPGNARYAISMSYTGNVGGVIYMDNLRVVKVE